MVNWTCSSSSNPEFLQSEDFLRTTLHIQTTLGIPIHVFGAYCILFKTPKQMSDMKWAMFNLHCWSVAFDLCVGFLFIPYLQLPAIAGVGLGLLTDFGIFLGDQAYFGMSVLGGVVVSVACLFETRFFHLYAKHTTWKCLRRPWLGANFMLAFTYLIPTYIFLPEQVSARRDLKAYIPCLPDFLFTDRFFIVTVHRGRVAANIGVVMLPIPGESMLFVFLIYWNMRQFSTIARLSKSTLKLQRKFLSALIFQVTIPIATLLLPILYFQYSIAIYYYNQGWNNVGIFIISMHGTASSIAMILIHKPYRDTLIGYFKGPQKTLAEFTAKISHASHVTIT